MKAAALPVFTVGVGQDRLARDIQVDRVTTPRRALKGTSLLIDAVVRQTGYAGETVTLDVEDGGRIVGIAGGEAAGRRRADVGARPRHGDRCRGRACFKFRVSPRDGRGDRAEQRRARRWSTSSIGASGSSITKGSRGSR